MCNTQVIIRDHAYGTTRDFIFSPRDKGIVTARWEDEDPLLNKLQSQTLFAERKRWCDLDQDHFRVLLGLHMSLVADLPEQHQANTEHPVVRSLLTLLIAFIHLIETKVGGSISLVNVSRISETVLTYDIAASLDDMEFPRPRNGGLKVVVDNSR